MRGKLGKLGKKDRHLFEGTILRFGECYDMYSPYRDYMGTILFGNVHLVKEDGSKEYLTDHLWMKFGLQFQRVDAKEGDVLRFFARVSTYRKRDEGGNLVEDFNLSRPTKVINVSRPDAKVEVPTVKEQQSKLKEKWAKEKEKRVEEAKKKVASEAQTSYIRSICAFLGLEVPSLVEEGTMLASEAHSWISTILESNPDLLESMSKVRQEEKKKATRERNRRFYELVCIEGTEVSVFFSC